MPIKELVALQRRTRRSVQAHCTSMLYITDYRYFKSDAAIISTFIALITINFAEQSTTAVATAEATAAAAAIKMINIHMAIT